VVDGAGITVSDNGLGISTETVKLVFDFGDKTSRREAYVSPTRGAQGNALQTLLAMPYALTQERGETVIESGGLLHRIAFTIDPVRQTPNIDYTSESSDVAKGTKVTIVWPEAHREYLDEALNGIRDAAENYCWFNPHLALGVKINDDEKYHFEAYDPSWTKWLPSMPTSAHWYDVSRLKNLIAKTVASAIDNGEPCPTVRDFLKDFDSLSSTVKRSAICNALDMSRAPLSSLVGGDNDTDNVRRLLQRMKLESRKIKPRNLGLIGEALISEQFEDLNGVDMDSFRYRKVEITDYYGVPYLIETAFVSRPDCARALITGLNWSVTVGQHPFRKIGDEMGLDGLLSLQRAGFDEPIVVFLHIVSPRLEFRDKGKGSVKLPNDVGRAVYDAVTAVTDRWAKQRKREERDASAIANRRARLAGNDDDVSFKSAAYEVISAAYAAASDNGNLPANARQIMYAARGAILKATGKSKMSDSYFTQTLLVDYMNDNPEECSKWNVVWSDRGHFTEPHTRKLIGLGTLAIRDYINGYAEPSFNEAGFKEAKIKTHGPNGRYGALLYIEKEGFDPLIEAAQISERFDIAVFSCKGMSVTAARELVDRTCERYKLPLFIMRDFDVSGFNIKKTLHTSNRRFRHTTEGKYPVHDIGLRLDDIEYFENEEDETPLESEPAYFEVNARDPGAAKESRRETLRANGATEEEIVFLMDDDNPDAADNAGRRVELNAMTSRQFVELIERKLTAHSVTKVVPASERVDEAFRLFVRNDRLKVIVETAMQSVTDTPIAVPDDLEAQVRALCLPNIRNGRGIGPCGKW